MNPLIQGHCRTAPDTSRNVFSIGQGTNEVDSQSNPHPEAGLFNNQITQNSGPEDRHDKNTVEESVLSRQERKKMYSEVIDFLSNLVNCAVNLRQSLQHVLDHLINEN